MAKPGVKDLPPESTEVQGGTKGDGGNQPCTPRPPIIKLPPVFPASR